MTARAAEIANPPMAYRPKRAARELGVSLATLYRRFKAKDIIATKFGGATLISHVEILRVTNADRESAG